MENRLPDELVPKVLDALQSLEGQPKVSKKDLADCLTALGVKNAYNKIECLPRISPAKLDIPAIFAMYGNVTDANGETTVLDTSEETKPQPTNPQESTVSEEAPAFSKDGKEYARLVSATDNPNQNKMIKTEGYRKLEKLLGGKLRLNIFIDGDTGLGKSTSVIDILGKQKRSVLRLNLSFAVDVDDLIGGFRLVNGDTIWEDGPITYAMRNGIPVLADELDAANPKILFELQSVMEGNGVFLKKIKEMVFPEDGFQVIATGNTKGRGDMTGDFAGVNILNKAFLDRFHASLTFYPPTEKEMNKILTSNSSIPALVCSGLASWYQQIIDTEKAGGVTQILSPRRMLAITYMAENWGVDSITHPELKEAADYATNGYDVELKEALIELMDRMVDEEKEKAIPEATTTDIIDDDSPF